MPRHTTMIVIPETLIDEELSKHPHSFSDQDVLLAKFCLSQSNEYKDACAEFDVKMNKVYSVCTKIKKIILDEKAILPFREKRTIQILIKTKNAKGESKEKTIALDVNELKPIIYSKRILSNPLKPRVRDQIRLVIKGKQSNQEKVFYVTPSQLDFIIETIDKTTYRNQLLNRN